MILAETLQNRLKGIIKNSIKEVNIMAVWRCTICNYEYDEAVEGTPFEKLPDDWKCPICNASKDAFEKIS